MFLASRGAGAVDEIASAYTATQVILLTKVAKEVEADEAFLFATAVAVGSNYGFTGNKKALESFGKKLKASGAEGGMKNDIQKMLKGLVGMKNG